MDRCLAHIIKFSEQPHPVRFYHPTPHYLGSDLLHHIIYLIPSGMKLTWLWGGGGGERSLITSELRDALDISSWIHEVTTGLPPIKTLLATF
jgi:hypothetical protein